MSHSPFPVPPNPARVPPELAARYATAGPRYTSYPTAPHFTPEVDRAELEARWKAGNTDGEPISVYLHIPFCRERCFFCGCFTHIASKPEAADAYLDDLAREFDITAGLIDPARPLEQLSMGGGTPTFLSPERLDRLLTRLFALYRPSPTAELAIEIDPRTVVPEHVDVLVAHGFNRFSMGVQDFNERVLEIVHRRQSHAQTLDLVERLRAAGHDAINFDLIYGLPGQSPESMRDTAARCIAIAPSRIALYSYAHVPWMKGHQKILERPDLPGPEQKLALFGEAYDAFTEAGYVPVGMDHFARPEDEMTKALLDGTLHRNFMGYTTRRGLDLVGFGVSAISSVARSYAQNEKNFDAYAESLKNGQRPLERGFLLSDDDAMRRALIIDLFCNFTLDLAAFGQRWALDPQAVFADELQRLTPFVDDGLLEIRDRRLTVSPLGRAFIRNICMVFDRYLERDLAQRRYSQTV